MTKIGIPHRKSGVSKSADDRIVSAIDEFRKELKERDHHYHDMVSSFSEIEDEEHALKRYLMGQKYNVQKTLHKMDKSLELFKESKSESFYMNDPDQVVDAPLSAVLSQFPYFFHGVDKEGNPLCYFLGGIVDIDGVNCLTDKKRLLPMSQHLMMHDAKRLLINDREKNPDRQNLELFTIIDATGLSLTNVSVSYVSTLASVIAGLGDLHPEMMNKWVVINAPSFFSMAWSIIKTLIPAHIVDNVKIFSSNKESMKYLQEHISKENLVSDYGGESQSFSEIWMQKGTNRELVIRQIVKHFSLSRSLQYKCGFVISANEKVTFTIYTRSEHDFKVVLMNNNDEVVSEEIFQKKDDAPYHHVVVPDFCTPGNYVISCQPNSWSLKSINFVLVGDVSKNESPEK